MEKLQFIIEAKDKFSGELNGLMKHLNTLPGAAMLAAGAIASVGLGLFKIMESGNEARNEMKRVADQLGLTTEYLSKMSFAANMADVSQEELNIGFKMLNRTIGDASMGAEKGIKAFSALGISIRNGSGDIKSIEEVLPEIAERFQGLDSAAQKTAMAMQLFGRGGAAMVPLLNEGKEGLAAATAEAEKYGIVLSTKNAQAAEEFEQSQKRMKAAVKGLMGTIVTEATPAFAGAYSAMSDAIADNRKVIAGWADTTVSALSLAAKVLAYTGAAVIDSGRGWNMIFITMRGGIAQWAAWFVEKLGFVAIKYGEFLSMINVKGAFDGAIANLYNFNKSCKDVAGNLTFVRDEAADALDRAIDSKMAITRVKEFGDKVKAEAARIKAGAGEGSGGAPGLNLGGEGAGTGAAAGAAAAPDPYAYMSDFIDPAGENSILERKRKANDEILAMADENRERAMQDLSSLGYAWSGYEAARVAEDREAVDNIIRATGDLDAARAYADEAERIRLLEKNRFILDNTNSLTEGLTAAWSNFALQSGTFMGDVSEASVDMFNNFSAMSGDAIASVLVYGESMSAAFKNLMKSIAAQAISALVSIGVTRAAQWVMAQVLGIAEASTRMGILTAETYAGAFAATACIPVIGPIIAPGVAAASTAAMIAGAAASAAAGKGTGMAIGKAHGGLDFVPDDNSTYVLKRGERVLAPRQNEDLTEFLAGGGAGGSSQPMAEAIHIHILENATDLDTLRGMDRRDWEDLIEDKMVPALNELRRRGVYR